MSPRVAFVPAALTRLPTSSITALTTSPPTIPPSTHHLPLPTPLRRAHLTTPPPSAPSPTKPPSRILLWFHTDLRLSDNPALLSALRTAALPGGCLVPVAAGAALDPRAAPLLAELKALLQALGSDLLAVPGNVSNALIHLCKSLNLSAVYFNRSVLPARVAVEKRVINSLTDAGIAVEPFWGNVLQPPLSGTPPTATATDAHEGEYALTALSTRLSSGVASPEAAPDRLPPLPAAARRFRGQRVVEAKTGGGTARAMSMLARMEKSTETLTVEKSPDLAVLLKTFLDYGALSPRMVAQKCVDVVGACSGRTFSELVWREYVCFAAHRGAGLAVGKKVTV